MLTLINPGIHKEAKLKKETFLDRVKNVKAIRTSYIERNFLCGEDMEWEILDQLYKAINKGIFKFSFDKIFAFQIEEDLYKWFRNNDLQTIQKQVVNWIAAVYLSNPHMRTYLDEYIYIPVLTEAKEVIQKYYLKDAYNKYEMLEMRDSLFNAAYGVKRNKQRIEDLENYVELNGEKLEQLEKEWNEEYMLASYKYINCHPPKFLKNPMIKSRVKFDEYGLRHSPFIRIRTAFFTETDWITIVERSLPKFMNKNRSNIDLGIMTADDVKRILKRSETDDLIRTESDITIWNNWLYAYRNYDSTKNIIYRMFEEEPQKGIVYIIRQKDKQYFKIGWTETKGLDNEDPVKTRMKQLQTGSPDKLEIVGCFNARSKKTEQALHTLFASNRVNGEWFNLTLNDCQNILDTNWRIENSIF